MPTLDDTVRALASPILVGGNVYDASTARARIETLFGATSAATVLPVLLFFAERGMRAEWPSYEAHAGGAWKPEARDRDLARKAAFTVAHRARLSGRGLVALDAMRASVLVEWCVLGGLLERTLATEAIRPIVTLSLAKHASWADYAEQLLLGLEFAEGSVDPALRDRISAPRDSAWASELTLDAAAPDGASEPVSKSSAKGTAPLILAMRLGLDCPACKHPVLLGCPREHVDCGSCGEAFSLSPAEWSGFFERDFSKLRRGADNPDEPYGSDFGARFLSRRMTLRVANASCPCGAPIHAREPGKITCGCGRSTLNRAPDVCAKAIAPDVTLVIEPGGRPIDPTATFVCAACDAEQPLGIDPSRIRLCNACKMHTYVDDAAHQRSFDPPRWPTFYLVLDGEQGSPHTIPK